MASSVRSARSGFTSRSAVWPSAARDFRASRSARPPSTGNLTRPYARSSRILEVWIDHANREVWLSAIFDFYTQDFLAHAPSLIAYVNRYRATQIPADFNVRFLDYHWTVNHRKWAYVK